MRLLLRGDVEGVGQKGDIVDVSPGYGRNYLVPKGLALPAAPGVAAQAGAMRRSRDQKNARERGTAEDIATALVGRPITVGHQAGEGGRLFGSVTATDIAEEVYREAGIDLDRKRLNIDEAIRSIGTHTVMVKLHADVEFPLTVEVVEI